MKSVTDARGLSEIRTAITSRIHSRPPQKGTAHLDLYLLDMEKQRLEKELALLERRRERIREHLAEIAKTVAQLGQAVPSPKPPAEEGPFPEHNGRQWRKIALDY